MSAAVRQAHKTATTPLAGSLDALDMSMWRLWCRGRLTPRLYRLWHNVSHAAFAARREGDAAALRVLDEALR